MERYLGVSVTQPMSTQSIPPSFRYSLYAAVLLGTLLAGLSRPSVAPHQQVRASYQYNLGRLDTALVRLSEAVANQRPGSEVHDLFRQARQTYKQTETLTDYFFVLSARNLNGPNVPEGEADDGATRIIQPEGFQVIESLLFPYDTARRNETIRQLVAMRHTLSLLRRTVDFNEFTDSYIFDALRQEIYRIETLGITGFDSPIALQSLPEAVVALESIRQTLAYYPLRQTQPALARQLNRAFVGAERMLQRVNSFDAFDRLTFIRQYAHPLSRLLLQARLALGIPAVEGRFTLNPNARTLSEPDAFSPTYFTHYNQLPPSPNRIALGRRLFADPILSAEGSGRSCASCHRPDRAFQDGEPTALMLGTLHSRPGRNTPTLWNVAFQSVQFMDMRSFSVEQQIQDVVQNPHEMGGSVTSAVPRLNRQPDYRAQFAAAYSDTVTTKHMLHALATYVRSLVNVDTRTDRYLRGQPARLSADEKLGFNVFMGKGKCATCHYFPLYNGLLPPAYSRTESEVIGVPATADNRQISPDPGRQGITSIAIHQGSFKVPGLRFIAKTAPYMHNGAYQTLEQVVDFYDRGGGLGLGFALPNQTLPAEKLHLTSREKKALVAFLRSL